MMATFSFFSPPFSLGKDRSKGQVEASAAVLTVVLIQYTSTIQHTDTSNDNQQVSTHHTIGP